ncbi:hypothetical protein, partial [Rodentibacter myodis]|uniref:hypothetical protein n=1 Tax=Rodentibacter myodis TaxID=1907939 RepID=UPI001FC94495
MSEFANNYVGKSPKSTTKRTAGMIAGFKKTFLASALIAFAQQVAASSITVPGTGYNWPSSQSGAWDSGNGAQWTLTIQGVNGIKTGLSATNGTEGSSSDKLNENYRYGNGTDYKQKLQTLTIGLDNATVKKINKIESTAQAAASQASQAAGAISTAISTAQSAASSAGDISKTASTAASAASSAISAASSASTAASNAASSASAADSSASAASTSASAANSSA